jgi:hypothetical protein
MDAFIIEGEFQELTLLEMAEYVNWLEDEIDSRDATIAEAKLFREMGGVCQKEFRELQKINQDLMRRVTELSEPARTSSSNDPIEGLKVAIGILRREFSGMLRANEGRIRDGIQTIRADLKSNATALSDHREIMDAGALMLHRELMAEIDSLKKMCAHQGDIDRLRAMLTEALGCGAPGMSLRDAITQIVANTTSVTPTITHDGITHPVGPMTYPPPVSYTFTPPDEIEKRFKWAEGWIDCIAKKLGMSQTAP